MISDADLSALAVIYHLSSTRIEDMGYTWTSANGVELYVYHDVDSKGVRVCMSNNALRLFEDIGSLETYLLDCKFISSGRSFRHHGLRLWATDALMTSRKYTTQRVFLESGDRLRLFVVYRSLEKEVICMTDEDTGELWIRVDDGGGVETWRDLMGLGPMARPSLRLQGAIVGLSIEGSMHNVMTVSYNDVPIRFVAQNGGGGRQLPSFLRGVFTLPVDQKTHSTVLHRLRGIVAQIDSLLL